MKRRPGAPSALASLAGTLLLLISLAVCAWAQNSSDQSSDSGQSWNSTTNLQSPSSMTNPTRVTQSHKQDGGRSVDTQRLERQDIDGHYQTYGETETETVNVNSTTTRVITRHFVTDADGRKTLNTITEEETHSAPGGRESMVRTVSNPDANGALQVSRLRPALRPRAHAAPAPRP